MNDKESAPAEPSDCVDCYKYKIRCTNFYLFKPRAKKKYITIRITKRFCIQQHANMKQVDCSIFVYNSKNEIGGGYRLHIQCPYTDNTTNEDWNNSFNQMNQSIKTLLSIPSDLTVFDLKTQILIKDMESYKKCVVLRETYWPLEAMHYLLVLENGQQPPHEIKFAPGYRPLDYRDLKYTPEPVVSTDELELYEERGRVIRQDQMAQESSFLKDLDRVINKIQETSKKSVGRIPYVVICTSSGNGKTQLPFEIDTPLLYFIYQSKNFAYECKYNELYKNFRVQSNLFDKNLNDDRENFNCLYPQRSGDKEYTFEMLQNAYSRAAGFLVKFVEQTLQIVNDQHVSWIRAQLMCKEFEFNEMRIDKARERLQKIREEKGIELPTIFLDDTKLKAKRFRTIPEFRFVRSFIIALGFPLVVMSASLNSVFEFDSDIYKEIPDSHHVPWCYLATKLPPTSQELLNENYFNHILKRLEALELVDTELALKLRSLVDMFRSLLYLERPSFALQMADELKRFIDSIEPVAQTDCRVLICDFLENMLKSVFTKFVEKTDKYSEDFSLAQLNFIDGSGSFHYAISEHLANAVVENAKDPFFVEFKLNFESIWRKLSYNSLKGPKYFDLASSFPEFKDKPLTSLCFSGPKLARDQVFRFRCSALYVLYQYYFYMIRFPYRSRLSIDFIENSTCVSLILATHVNGLTGRLYFRDIFVHFLHQMQKYLTGSVPKVDFSQHDQLWNLVDTEIMPYSGICGGRWNDIVYQYLTRELGCQPGICESSKSATADIVLYADNTKMQELICLIARCQESPSPAFALIKDRIVRARKANSRAKINILFATEICDIWTGSSSKRKVASETVSLKRQAKDESVGQVSISSDSDHLNQKYQDPNKTQSYDLKHKSNERFCRMLEEEQVWLVRLVKKKSEVSKDQLEYEFKELYCPKTVNKVYILIDLKHNVSSEFHSDVLRTCRD